MSRTLFLCRWLDCTFFQLVPKYTLRLVGEILQLVSFGTIELLVSRKDDEAKHEVYFTSFREAVRLLWEYVW